MKRKSHQLPTKPIELKPQRAPVGAAGFLFRSVIRQGSNRQRSEPRTPTEGQAADNGSRVVKGVVIAFGVHILAIVLYFIHLNHLDAGSGKNDDSTTATRTEPQIPSATGKAAQRTEIISGDDTWATIAVRNGVDEARLREVNKGRPFENGRILIIPDENAGAVPPPSSTESRAKVGGDHGLVDVAPEVLDPADGGAADAGVPAPVPRATEVADPGKASAVKSSGKTHKVRQGETLSRICTRYKTDQRKLMELNGIKDPNKLKVGATLRIPE